MMDNPMSNPSFTVWLDAEEEKIRNVYKEKRIKISDDAFLVGLSSHNIKDDAVQRMSSEYKRTFRDEEAAVKSFRDNAVKHETERLKLNVVDQRHEIRRAWGLK